MRPGINRQAGRTIDILIAAVVDTGARSRTCERAIAGIQIVVRVRLSHDDRPPTSGCSGINPGFQRHMVRQVQCGRIINGDPAIRAVERQSLAILSRRPDSIQSCAIVEPA